MEQEVDAFIAEFPPVAAVLCAKPPPPPPPPLPEPTVIPIGNNEPSSHLDFHNFSSSFAGQGMQSTFVPPPNHFATMLSVPPPPNQQSIIFPGSSDSMPFYQTNISKPMPPPPAFFAPPPVIMDSQETGFSNSNSQQPDENLLKHNQLPPDFKINQPPPDFKADQLPPDFTVEKPPPSMNFNDLKANNSGSSSPIGAIRFDKDNDKNECSIEPIRSNPFAVDRKFPPANISGDQTRPNPPPTVTSSYTNPFSKPTIASQIFPHNPSGGPNRYQSTQNYTQANSLPQPNITSVPPPNAMFQFRAPPMFAGQQPPTLPPNPLHSIPPPIPLQLNKIPAPKELDLNAIPEPTLNVHAIKVPDGSDISRG